MKLRNKGNQHVGVSARALLSKSESPFEEIDLSDRKHPDWMTRCFRNNKYTVMVDDNRPVSSGKAAVALIQNHLNLPIKNHWSEMQRIKNEIFGAETVAIEYYPASSMLTDKANIYWMWIFPEGVLPMPI